MKNPTRRTRMKLRSYAAATGLASIAAGFVAPVLAQATDSKRAITIEEVIVTAQKRSQSIQDIPVAVTAVSAQDLADGGINDVADLAALIPSLVVTTNISPFNSSYRIRGIGNEGNIPTFEPSTGLFIDGAFRSRSGLGLGELVDVESIEVLKGPQSTLYGKNVTAGVISVNTKQPSDELEGMVETTYGADSLMQFKGSLNLPINDSSALRFGLVKTDRDPIQENVRGDDGRDLGQTAFRAQYRLDLNEQSSLRLIASKAKRKMAPTMGDIHYSPAHISIIEGAGESIQNNDAYDNRLEHIKNNTFTQDSSDATLTYEYTGDTVKVTSITGYEDYDIVLNLQNVGQMPFEVVSFRDPQEGTSFSQELRFSSSEEQPLNWITGLFYFESDFQRGGASQGEFALLNHVEEYGGAVARELLGLPQSAAVDAPILGVEGDKGGFTATQDIRSLGAFAHFTSKLSESFELVFGVRYSAEEKTGRLTQFNELSALGCIPPSNSNLICTIAPADENYYDSEDWEDWTGNISLSYFATSDTLFYATYATGFKAGGYNLGNGQFPSSSRRFGPESVANIELGWKTDFYDNRVRVNGAVFQAVYENYQNATFVGIQYVVNNAEEVSVNGLELETTALLSESLTATLAATYLDAVYDKYTGGACVYGVTPDNQDLNQCDLSGKNTPFAPDWSGSAILQWEQPMAGGDFYARADYQYTGNNNPSSELSDVHQRDPYGLVNARIGWRNESLDIVVWGKNLTDEVYLVQGGPTNLITTIDATVGSEEGSYQAVIGEYRSAGVTLRLYF